MPDLRHIAVHVEEPRSGQFVWVLTERSGEDWQPLDNARSAVRSYKAAMADGLLALQQLVDDLDIGPRVQFEEETPERPKARSAKPMATAGPAKGPYFGFGPAR